MSHAVPALPWLYGSLDTASEHHRRYGKGELPDRVTGAGCGIESVRFVNLLGVLGRTLERAAVRLYDRFVLRWASRIEGRLPPPIGQNLMLIARQEASA